MVPGSELSCSPRTRNRRGTVRLCIVATGEVGAMSDRVTEPSVPPTAWPDLTLAKWEETRDALHLWSQIVGKVRLALAPMVNHWWQVPFYVSARGLTT